MNYRFNKKSLLLLFMLLIAIALSLVSFINIFYLFPTSSITPKTTEHEFIQLLDQRVKLLMEKYAIPGVNIAIIRQGKILWAHAYGYADKEKGIPMKLETICRVESISKSVTAWGILKLVEHGAISLDDQVVKHLKTWKFPPSSFHPETITIRQLLSHSAGLPLGTIGVRYAPNDAIPTLQESLYKDAVMMTSPGSIFSYSNTGFNLLELIIEEVTNQPFAEYMQREILQPLSMKHSSYKWSNNFEPFPNGYTLDGKPIPAYVYPEKGAGGLFSTVEDITRFVTAGMTTFNNTGLKVLSLKSIQTLYEPTVKIPSPYGLAFPWYGLGHFIEFSKNNIKAVSHGGQGTGWMTHFHSIPETGDGIVMLTNSQRSWPFFAHILNDWAKWIGFDSVGMSKIIYAEIALWIIIYIISITLMVYFYGIIKGLLLKTRTCVFIQKKFCARGMLQLFAGITLFAIVVWAMNQDYMFITSVFPKAAPWLGYIIFTSGLVFLAYFFFPINERFKKHQYLFLKKNLT